MTRKDPLARAYEAFVLVNPGLYTWQQAGNIIGSSVKCGQNIITKRLAWCELHGVLKIVEDHFNEN